MKKLKAFTLIELLIVVAIIAILAAIAVPNFLEAQVRAKVSRAKSDIRSMQVALESYYVDNNNYPYTESINQSIWLPPGGRPRLAPAGHNPGGLTSPISYMTSIPVDVFTHAVLNTAGVPTSDIAPVYYERAGFGYTDGAMLTAKPSGVPAEAIGTGSLTGSGADTPVTSPLLTPRAYVLYSLGPDLTPFVVNPAGGFFTRSRWNINNRYDPTNGTISRGNILRFPGGESFP
jgi:type II secretion system protein G